MTYVKQRPGKSMSKKTTVLQILAIITVATMATGQMSLSKKQTDSKPVSGEAVFKSSCAQCHAGGGNMVHPAKPLAGSPKLASLPIFKAYLKAPLSHMPYFKYVVTDQSTLKALYDYCKSLKPVTQS